MIHSAFLQGLSDLKPLPLGAYNMHNTQLLAATVQQAVASVCEAHILLSCMKLSHFTMGAGYGKQAVKLDWPSFV